MKDILTHDIRNYNQIARANAELLESGLDDDRQLEFTRSILKAMDKSTELIQRTRNSRRPHLRATRRAATDESRRILRALVITHQERKTRQEASGLVILVAAGRGARG